MIDGSTGFDFRPKKQFIGGKNSRETLFEEVWYLKKYGTGSLVPAVFRSAVYTCAYFQKIPKIFDSCGFPQQ